MHYKNWLFFFFLTREQYLSPGINLLGIFFIFTIYKAFEIWKFEILFVNNYDFIGSNL